MTNYKLYKNIKENPVSYQEIDSLFNYINSELKIIRDKTLTMRDLMKEGKLLAIPEDFKAKYSDYFESVFGATLLGNAVTVSQGVSYPGDNIYNYIITFIPKSSNSDSMMHVYAYHQNDILLRFLRNVSTYPDQPMLCIDLAFGFSHSITDFINTYNKVFNTSYTVWKFNSDFLYVKNENANEIRKVIRHIIKNNVVECDYNDPQTMNFLIWNVYSLGIQNAWYNISRIKTEAIDENSQKTLEININQISLMPTQPQTATSNPINAIKSVMRKFSLDKESYCRPNQIENISYLNINQHQILNQLKDDEIHNLLSEFGAEFNTTMNRLLIELCNIMKTRSVNEYVFNESLNLTFIANNTQFINGIEIPINNKLMEMESSISDNYHIYFENLFYGFCYLISPIFNGMANYFNFKLMCNNGQYVIRLTPKPITLSPIVSDSLMDYHNNLFSKNAITYDDDFKTSWFLTSIYKMLLATIEIDIINNNNEDVIEYLNQRGEINIKPSSIYRLGDIFDPIYAKPNILGIIYDAKYDGYDIFKLLDIKTITINEYLNNDLNYLISCDVKLDTISQFKQNLDDINKKLIVKLSLSEDNQIVFLYKLVNKD